MAREDLSHCHAFRRREWIHGLTAEMEFAGARRFGRLRHERGTVVH